MITINHYHAKKSSGKIGSFIYSLHPTCGFVCCCDIVGCETQMQDALLVNLAGRQRMLIQRMTWLAHQLQSGDNSALVDLQESERTFSETLSALQYGGDAPYLTNSVANLPVTNNVQILAAMYEVETRWGQYRSILDAIIDSSNASPLRTDLETQSESLVQ